MSRLFDDAATEYVEIDQAVRTAVPFVMGCLFNSNDVNAFQCLMCICDKDAATDMHRLQIRNAGNEVQADSFHNPDYNSARSSTGYTVSTWHHACGLYVADAEVRALIDGGSKIVGTDEPAIPVNLDRTSIGREGDSTPTRYASGMIAEAAIWDLSVWPGATASDKADAFEKILPSLAKGFSPLFYPLGLVAHWPLVRGLNDKVGGYNLTANGTVVAAHSRIILPHNIL